MSVTGTAAIMLATLCMLLTGGLGVIFALNAERGLAMASHRAEQLPQAMCIRYFGTAALLLGVLLFGDLFWLAWFLAVVGIGGLGDTVIYARVARPYVPHLTAAILYLAAALLALLAHMSNGTT